MLKNVFAKIIGTRFDRELKKMQPIVDKIHAEETRLADCSQEELQGQTEKLRRVLKEKYGALELELAEKKGGEAPVRRSDRARSFGQGRAPTGRATQGRDRSRTE